MRKDGETFLTLYHDMEKYKAYTQKPPTAVCSWCTNNYDHKTRWCLTYKKTINEPLKPFRCVHYTGEPVTEDNLKSVYELLNAGNRLI